MARTGHPHQAAAAITHTLSAATNPPGPRDHTLDTGHPAAHASSAPPLPKRKPQHLRAEDQHPTAPVTAPHMVSGDPDNAHR